MSDLAAILTALGGLVAAFSLAALKMWSVVSEVNDQLRGIAREADERRDLAEESSIKARDEAETLRAEVAQLRAETAALREEVHELRREAAERDEELQELDDLARENERLHEEIADLEARLIKASNERDKYEQLWRDRADKRERNE
jgi:cell shape-determining protein MreC